MELDALSCHFVLYPLRALRHKIKAASPTFVRQKLVSAAQETENDNRFKNDKEVSEVSGLRGRRAQVRFLRGIPVTCCNLLYLHAVNWRHPLVLNSARR